MSDSQEIIEQEQVDNTQTEEKPITLGIVVFSETEELLSKAKEYESLTINGPGDKEGEKRVSEARKFLKKGRVNVEKVLKSYTNTAKQYIKQAQDKANPIIETVEKTEKRLQDEESRIEKLRQEAADKLKREQEELIISRVDRLLKTGLSFDGIRYEIGDCVIDTNQVKALDQADFEDFMIRASEAAIDEQKRKAEELRLKTEKEQREKEEREEFLRQKEEFEKQQREFQEAREKIQREKDDLEREQREAESKRIQVRTEELQSLGFVMKDGQFIMSKVVDEESILIKIGFDTVKVEQGESWVNILNQMMPNIKKINDSILKDKIAKDKADKKAAEEKAKKDKEATDKKKQQEEERLEGLKPDVQKLEELAKRLREGKVPEVTSKEAKQICIDIKVLYVKIAEHIETKIKTLNLKKNDIK